MPAKIILTKDAASPIKGGSKKLSWWLFFLSLLILSAAFYFGLVSRQWNKAGAGKEWDVARARADFDAKNHELSQLKQLLGQYQSLAPDEIELASRILPQQQDIPELLTQLELLAQQNGVNILSLTSSEIKEEAGPAKNGVGAAANRTVPYQQLSIKLDLDVRDYRSWKSFLAALQSHARLLDVETFSFDLEQQQQTLTLKTYFLFSK